MVSIPERENSVDSTIIGAIIGALATILGAFISKGYAERQVVTTQPTKPLNVPAASILHLLSKLSVNSAQVIRLKKNQVYISDSLDLVLTAEMLLSSLATVKLNVLGAQAQIITFHRGDVLSTLLQNHFKP